MDTPKVDSCTWEVIGKHLSQLARWYNEAHHTKMVVEMLLSRYVWDQGCKKQIKVMGTFSDKGFMPKLKEEVEVMISC